MLFVLVWVFYSSCHVHHASHILDSTLIAHPSKTNAPHSVHRMSASRQGAPPGGASVSLHGDKIPFTQYAGSLFPSTTCHAVLMYHSGSLQLATPLFSFSLTCSHVPPGCRKRMQFNWPCPHQFFRRVTGRQWTKSTSRTTHRSEINRNFELHVATQARRKRNGQ